MCIRDREGLITTPEDDPHVTSEPSENEEEDSHPTTPTDSKSIKTTGFTVAMAVTYHYV